MTEPLMTDRVFNRSAAASFGNVPEPPRRAI